MSKITTYNKKRFLLPDSPRSMASYHAKIEPDGRCLFSIHDCNGGIRLWNDLSEPEQVTEAVAKLMSLAAAAVEFAGFIQENYINTPE